MRCKKIFGPLIPRSRDTHRPQNKVGLAHHVCQSRPLCSLPVVIQQILYQAFEPRDVSFARSNALSLGPSNFKNLRKRILVKSGKNDIRAREPRPKTISILFISDQQKRTSSGCRSACPVHPRRAVWHRPGAGSSGATQPAPPRSRWAGNKASRHCTCFFLFFSFFLALQL